jgi:hypothetical protein
MLRKRLRRCPALNSRYDGSAISKSIRAIREAFNDRDARSRGTLASVPIDSSLPTRWADEHNAPRVQYSPRNEWLTQSSVLLIILGM